MNRKLIKLLPCTSVALFGSLLAAALGVSLMALPASALTTMHSLATGGRVPTSSTSGSREFEFTVSGALNSITDVDFRVAIKHATDEQLTLTLIAPWGASVILSDANGGQEDDYQGTLFDDSASTFINDSSGPFAGSFKPDGGFVDNTLSIFNGMDPNSASHGNNPWKLLVSDEFEGLPVAQEVGYVYGIDNSSAPLTSPAFPEIPWVDFIGTQLIIASIDATTGGTTTSGTATAGTATSGTATSGTATAGTATAGTATAGTATAGTATAGTATAGNTNAGGTVAGSTTSGNNTAGNTNVGTNNGTGNGAIPEPVTGTLAFLGMGTAAISALRRSRREV